MLKAKVNSNEIKVNPKQNPLKFVGKDGKLTSGRLKGNPEEARRIGRLGKGKSSPKKKLAMRIRALKQQAKFGDDVAQKLIDVMSEPDVSSLDIYLHIKKLKPDDFKDNASMVKLLIEWHKLQHGIKQDKPEVQINIQNNNFRVEEELDKFLKRVRINE